MKLVIEDTIDNVATLQDCTMDQGQYVQLLGENFLQTSTSVKWEAHVVVLTSSIFVYILFWLLKIPSDIQSSRMFHNEATMQELKSMFSEMKDLLNQQVIWFVSHVPQYKRHSWDRWINALIMLFAACLFACFNDAMNLPS